MRNVNLKWKYYLTLLGESTPTFGAKTPTSSVLFRLFVSPIVTQNDWKRNGGEGLACWVQYFESEHDVLPQQKTLNHHATEDGDISHTEEAGCGTDRMGVAYDR